MCGVGLLLTQGGVARLSSSFVFGVGHADRPIPEFLGLEALACLFYLAAVEIVRRAECGRPEWAMVALVAVLCRGVLWPAGMIQEVDAYRYVWDGQAVVQGANPYLLAPAEAHEGGAPPAATLSPEGQTVYARINYREIPTIYPPLAQLLFAASQLVTPWALGGWKGMLLAADLATFVLLALSLARVRRPLAWVVVFAWSPLALKELANSLHLDGFVVLGMASFVYALVHGAVRTAFAALAAMTLLKLFAVLLVPVLAAHAWRADRRLAVEGVGLYVALIGLAYLPWIDAGGRLFDGLFAFAQQWQRNDSLFTILSIAVGTHARWVSGACMVFAAAVATLGVLRKAEWKAVLAATLGVVTAVFLLAPTSNPWYFTWTLPLLVFFPSRALLLLSALLFLYYADFYFLYRDAPQGFDVVRVVEYLPFYLVLIWEIWEARRAAGGGSLLAMAEGPRAMRDSPDAGPGRTPVGAPSRRPRHSQSSGEGE